MGFADFLKKMGYAGIGLFDGPDIHDPTDVRTPPFVPEPEAQQVAGLKDSIQNLETRAQANEPRLGTPEELASKVSIAELEDPALRALKQEEELLRLRKFEDRINPLPGVKSNEELAKRGRRTDTSEMLTNLGSVVGATGRNSVLAGTLQNIGTKNQGRQASMEELARDDILRREGNKSKMIGARRQALAGLMDRGLQRGDVGLANEAMQGLGLGVGGQFGVLSPAQQAAYMRTANTGNISPIMRGGELEGLSNADLGLSSEKEGVDVRVDESRKTREHQSREASKDRSLRRDLQGEELAMREELSRAGIDAGLQEAWIRASKDPNVPPEIREELTAWRILSETLYDQLKKLQPGTKAHAEKVGFLGSLGGLLREKLGGLDKPQPQPRK